MFYLGSNPQFLEHFSVNLARSAKIDNSSVQSGEQSHFSHKIIMVVPSKFGVVKCSSLLNLTVGNQNGSFQRKCALPVPFG